MIATMMMKMIMMTMMVIMMIVTMMMKTIMMTMMVIMASPWLETSSWWQAGTERHDGDDNDDG